MTDVTRILSQIELGDPHAAAELLPLVYAELRKLAAAKLAYEKPGQTLQATALVHEAYIRLVGDANAGGYDGQRHFFAAAAEAMRRILVENARRKLTQKRGGGLERADANLDEPLETVRLRICQASCSCSMKWCSYSFSTERRTYDYEHRLRLSTSTSTSTKGLNELSS